MGTGCMRAKDKFRPSLVQDYLDIGFASGAYPSGSLAGGRRPGISSSGFRPKLNAIL